MDRFVTLTVADPAAVRAGVEVRAEAEGFSQQQVQLLEAVVKSLLTHDAAGDALPRFDDYSEVADSIVDSLIDTAEAWQASLGPVYDTKGVARLLGSPHDPLTRQAVHKRALLALQTRDRHLFYPAFQFDGHEVVDGIPELLAILDESLVSRWTLAAWLVSTDPALDGQQPIAMLKTDKERVLGLASSWAGELAA